MTPTFPASHLAQSAITFLRAHVTEPVANHSLRSHLFATLHAQHEGLQPGVDFDDELLFLACALHDLGTSPQVSGKQRFEIDGADLAAAFLAEHGLAAQSVDLVWDAIALHSSPGLADRRSALAYLTRRGVVMDFGRDAEFVTDAQADEIHARLPRLRMEASLVDGIVQHAARGPQNAPRFTLAGELVRERTEDPARLSSLEKAALTSRWHV